MEKLLTIRQLGELIQVSPKTIYQWTHIEFIPCYKFPKGVRFKVTEIEEWLQKRKKRGRGEYKVLIN